MMSIPQSSIDQCIAYIQNSERMVVLTGAGISTNAGIPDFRGPQGLYITRQYDPDVIFDLHAFQNDPRPFYEFAKDFLNLEHNIQPTKAHHFLTHLETKGKLKGIITQNIDGLHQKAGTQNVVELHGSFQTSHCLSCEQAYTFEETKQMILSQDIPYCSSCSGLIKPDIVFFGEAVNHFSRAVDLAEDSDLFFVIGSSCVVQPAASLPGYTFGKVIVLNQGDVQLTNANLVLTIQSDIDTFFNELAEHI